MTVNRSVFHGRVERLVVVALVAAVVAVGGGSGPALAVEAPPLFAGRWGTTGSDSGEFQHPRGVAVDAAGNVYVADSGNNRVQKFTSTGTYLTQWGTYGSGNGQFGHPEGVAVDGDGNVYVTEDENSRVQKFTSTGIFLTRWGTWGKGNGQVDGPHGVAVDEVGNVYVADTYNHRVQMFTSSGVYLTQWGTFGDDEGEFRSPDGLAVDARGNVYVTDHSNDWVNRFGRPSPDGRIRTGATGTSKGDDIFNSTGVGQTSRGSAARGGAVTYFVSIQNDGPFFEDFRLKGGGTTSAFTVRYTNPQRTNITDLVSSGSYTTPELAPGATFTVKVVVTVRSVAPPGASLTRTLKATSAIDTTRKDTVRFVTSRT